MDIRAIAHLESSAELASSRIRIGGAPMRTLAIAIRCCCPPDRALPRDPTFVSYLKGVEGQNTKHRQQHHHGEKNKEAHVGQRLDTDSTHVHTTGDAEKCMNREQVTAGSAYPSSRAMMN